MNPARARVATVPVGIALGSNQGDRLANLQAAREHIVLMCPPADLTVPTCRSAPVFETAPVGCAPGTGAFLNTVLELDCAEPFSAEDLLLHLQGIEEVLGRPTRHPRNASRTIDLDILYAGEHLSAAPGLTLPHPRLTQRAFVLAPLAEIRPELVLPGEDRSVAELLHALPPSQKVVLYASRW